MFDYKQNPLSDQGRKNWDKIFKKAKAKKEDEED